MSPPDDPLLLLYEADSMNIELYFHIYNAGFLPAYVYSFQYDLFINGYCVRNDSLEPFDLRPREHYGVTATYKVNSEMPIPSCAAEDI